MSLTDEAGNATGREEQSCKYLLLELDMNIYRKDIIVN
jgi:hypothetical protein